MSRIPMTYAQEVCVRRTGKLMQKTAMIAPGARIGVAVSGGMDSWALLRVLLIRQRIVPFPFSVMALHVNPGFDPANHGPMADFLRSHGVAGHLETTDHGPRAHSPENRKKSACFYCAMLRRKRLFELCGQYRLTHLAFGHNADDLAATFMLNLLQTGRVEGMSIREDFFSGRLTVIRPMLLVEKKYIAKAVRQWDLPVWANPCPSAGNTARSGVSDDLEKLCAGSGMRRRNLFNGLCRWQLDKTLNRQGPSPQVEP